MLPASFDTDELARRVVQDAWTQHNRVVSAREVSAETLSEVVPYSYQQEAIKFLSERSGALLADDCGLGKTLCAIETAKQLRLSGPKLVVCNKRAIEWWYQEIHRQCPNASVHHAEVGGRNDVNWALWRSRRPDVWFIIHWEGLVSRYASLAPVLWDVVVADEAHKIRNRKTRRSVALKSLLSVHKIALSATDMEHSPADLWSILNWFDKDKFSSYWDFYNEFVDYKSGYFGGYEIKGIKNKDKLGVVLAEFVLRRTKQEVAPQLPPKIFTSVPIELDSEQRKWYRKFAKEWLIDLERGDGSDLFINGILDRSIKCRQVALDPMLVGVECSSAKHEWIKEYLSDNPNEIIVVLTTFRGYAQRLSRETGASLVIGGNPGSAPTISDWLKGRARILVGTIGAAGESLNLQRAGTLIFADKTFSSTQVAQAIDRIHRIDITEPKQIISLEAEHTIDLLIKKALLGKWTLREVVHEAIRHQSRYI